VVLADEPTGNLDTKSGENVIDLLASLHRELETH
jgi:ABC-type lipoprotein export system ATPase subunit